MVSLIFFALDSYQYLCIMDLKVSDYSCQDDKDIRLYGGDCLRVLEQQVIIRTALLLSMLLVLYAVNLYFFIRLRWSKLSSLFHTASFFALTSIFCFLMDTVILALPLEHIFEQIGTVSLVLCLIIMISPIFLYIFIGEKTFLHFHLMPNLKSVFTSIDDLAIIVDYKGVIAETNHPGKLEALLGGECSTTTELISRLRHKTSENNQENLESILFNSDDKKEFEVHFPEASGHYLLSITPVVAGMNHLGAIIILHNITEIKNSEQQLKIHNGYLKEANLKLSNYVKIANVLEAEKVRLNLLEQVQMGLTCKIEQAITHVQHIHKTSYESINAYKDDIAKVGDMLRDVYKDVRKSIQSISGKERG